VTKDNSLTFWGRDWEFDSSGSV